MNSRVYAADYCRELEKGERERRVNVEGPFYPLLGFLAPTNTTPSHSLLIHQSLFKHLIIINSTTKKDPKRKIEKERDAIGSLSCSKPLFLYLVVDLYPSFFELSSSLLQTNLHQMTPVSLRIEELMGGKRKGIGSILDLRTEKRESLRRTFSADMSSKKWLAQNTTISSIDTSSSSDDEDEGENKDVWSSIQLQKTTNMNSPINAPYIHPLVKRSSTSLGEKSLQICTESLGSETGSDGYSCDQNYFQSSSSEVDDDDEEQVVRNETQSRTKDLVTVNYNCCVSRRSPACSFPPPLSSISRRDGLSVQMRPQRRNGRLIIEAVPVSSHYYLHAHRQGGRLQLSFINSPSKEVPHIPPQREETEESSKEEEEEEEEEEEKIIVLEVKAKQEEEMRAGHPTFLVMNKLICGMHAMRLNNPNPWMDKKMDRQDEQRERERPSSKIFNGYDRCWKLGPMSHQSAQSPPNMLMVPKKKQVMIMGEDLLPVIRRCNEPLPLRPVIVL